MVGGERVTSVQLSIPTVGVWESWFLVVVGQEVQNLWLSRKREVVSAVTAAAGQRPLQERQI